MSDQRMTPQEKRDFERAALRGLADHLRSRGMCVEELGHPEDDRSNPLAVDTALLIDGEYWAAEHTRIVYDHRRPPLRGRESATYDPYSPGSPSNIGYGCNSASMHLVGREGTPGANANMQP